MQIMGNGLDLTTGTVLVRPVDAKVFGQGILRSLDQNVEQIRGLSAVTRIAKSFRGKVERARSADLYNPREAGWTYLVNKKQPGLKDFVKALRPLAEHRGMSDPKLPLAYDGEAEDEWADWLQKNRRTRDGGQVPHYILIVGGPDYVPFHFQSLLDIEASVGRVDLDSPDDLRAYVDKIIRLETADAPVTERKAVVFAPDAGPDDATHYSRLYMAEPLADHVQDKHKLQVNRLIGPNATKDGLVAALRGAKPALVYTASHGLGAPQESLDVQRRLNGAICCQARTAGEPLPESLFAADDVPSGEPFLEGAVFFQFACFGYGTPAESDFKHWLSKPGLNAKASFVAALPKRLLSHPHGPAVFIGHVDAGWMHGFIDNPEHPDISGRWQQRIGPFVSALDSLLGAQPVGQALASMNQRYSDLNWKLADTYDRIRRGEQNTRKLGASLADTFVLRSDAQNYMVFGDPAVWLCIPRHDIQGGRP